MMQLTGNVQGLLELIGGGDSVTISTEFESGTLLATITLNDDDTYYIYAPTPPTPTEVNVNAILNSGEHIADIEVNGVTSGLYAPKSEIIYSTEERKVGVWVDNKPLYQKTKYFGEISTNTNYGLTMDIGVNIVDTVINMFANAKVSSGAWVILPYPLPNAEYAAYLDGYNLSTDKLTIKTGNARSFVEGYATIYYTKTTDS